MPAAALREPADRLLVHMENVQDDARKFDATLQLDRRPLDARGLAYSAAIGVGAARILASLGRDFNLSAVAIEVF